MLGPPPYPHNKDIKDKDILVSFLTPSLLPSEIRTSWENLSMNNKKMYMHLEKGVFCNMDIKCGKKIMYIFTFSNHTCFFYVEKDLISVMDTLSL